MQSKVSVYDPTLLDDLSKVRGVGRYLQILRENFPNWEFSSNLTSQSLNNSVFINPFFNFHQPPLITRRIAKKQIAVIHDLITLKYPEHFPTGLRGNLNIWRNKLSLRNYDLIVTDSEASKKDIVNILKVDETKVKVIYPCLPKLFGKGQSVSVAPPVSINVQRQTIRAAKTPTKPFVLYVGDVTWNKNLVNLAKAIKLTDVQCLFVGKNFVKSVDTNFSENWEDPESMGGPTSKKNSVSSHNPWKTEFYEFLELAKNDDRFVFKGFVSDQELIKLYQQAGANILVSRDEGFGFSYHEASTQDCPSILSDIPVLRETAVDTALFANPNNPQEIANKINELFNNEDLRKDLIKKSKERAAKFSSSKLQKDFLRLL